MDAIITTEELAHFSDVIHLGSPKPLLVGFHRHEGIVAIKKADAEAPASFQLLNADGYPTSSRIAFLTLFGTGAYLSGSITLDARPVVIERSSVV